VKTPGLRTSWTPQSNSTKTFAFFSEEPPLLSTSSFWVWVAPSTTLTLWSLLRNWVLILKEVRSMPQALYTLYFCPYQTCPFQYCYQLSSGAGFRPSLQPSWSPLIFPFLFAVEELIYGTRYQSGSFLAKPQSWGAAPRFVFFPPKFTSVCAGPPSPPPAPKTCKAPKTD